ncbi:MAG: murein DD-endopeptidase MepM/ murein hydrolase activator NlpD [Bacteroidia bacterium]|jgi:murein DD-endopeptidase MepM/ murein hydrolase activator NlpD
MNRLKLSRFKEFFTKKIRNKYRLIIRNDQSLEERISVVLTPLNVLLISSGSLVFFTAVLIFLIPYTPLRTVVPGSSNLKAGEVHVLLDKIERMESEMNALQKQNNQLLQILRSEGDESSFYTPKLNQRPLIKPAVYYSNTVKFIKTSTSTELTNDKGSQSPDSRMEHSTFFAPLRGIISDTFSYRNGHTAVDVVSYINAAVKATMDGTVIVSSWTPETGNILVIQHPNNIISTYKHNAVLLKKQGVSVSAGEVIAIVGNSGELTSGPHLHFELWQNGRAVNPLDYMKF